MTDQFICRACAGNIIPKNEGHIHGASPGVICYYENASSAFPINKLKDLVCIQGKNRISNWEHVDGWVDVYIPRNFKSDLTQKEVRGSASLQRSEDTADKVEK